MPAITPRRGGGSRALRIGGRAALAALAIAAFGCAAKLSTPGAVETTNIPCTNAYDCPPAQNSCVISTCVDRYCAMVAAAEKTPMNEQKQGDCALLVCDGKGGTEPLEDPQDWPADDGNACTDEVCDEGKPGHPPLEMGAKCGDDGVCNGKGVCGVCLPGKKRCNTNTPEECSEEGQWASAEACPDSAPICQGEASCLRIAGVTAGGRATCARFIDGTLRCWGDRASGVLSGAVATPVIGLYGAADIAAGKQHTCAALHDGTASCWGNNADGELGDKTLIPKGAPVAVADVRDVAQVAVGVGFSCARLMDGQVKCWGRNDKGQLGLGSAAKSAATAAAPEGEPYGPPSPPALFHEVSRPAMLSLGDTHGCALVSGGAAVCWGDDTFGQLGRGSTPPAPVVKGRPPPAPKAPAPVKGLKDAAEIAAGDAHVCARLADGSVACWGDNAEGQLGDGTTAGKTSPVKVSGLADVTALALGRKHSCALLADGSVRCWGDNALGQIGDESTERRPAPAQVAGLEGAKAITARGDHTCVSLASGAIRCWGANTGGQLGDGSTENRPKAVPVHW